MLGRTLEGISSRLPGHCAVCHRFPAHPVCEPCVGRFAQPLRRCSRCALPLGSSHTVCARCTASPPPLDACHAAVSYDYPWSELITQFKFRGQAGWARAFAMLMRSAPWTEPALDAAQLLVPMPLSAPRLAQRGFNQAFELAKQLDARKAVSSLLLRLRETPAQAALDLQARLANVRGAFAVDPLRVAAVKGKRIVLVDDVMTSGASLHAAAQALRQAGAASVTGLVFARTDEPH
ncbi:ComF family protein [Caenimonas koreensis DSM 17982]|uniref:ComF family protein n=1 Tax=Caenimonas koreensis DSM 17982 TaxID=1121255 RepID=A0A844AW88_9BURK|nr:ComF family protein [Caenimonas koreensis DSM 17982]